MSMEDRIAELEAELTAAKAQLEAAEFALPPAQSEKSVLVSTARRAVAAPAAAPMRRGEREDLAKLIRHRERVLKTAATQRSAELLAEFEQQLASVYSFDQDEVWKAAATAANEMIKEAQSQIDARCAELGIPKNFGPGISCAWYHRGQNAAKERRAELRAVAKARIGAIERAARTRIEMRCLEAQTELTANGLTSAAARSFFNTLPSVEQLMPPLEFQSIETMLQARKAEQIGYGMSIARLYENPSPATSGE